MTSPSGPDPTAGAPPAGVSARPSADSTRPDGAGLTDRSAPEDTAPDDTAPDDTEFVERASVEFLWEQHFDAAERAAARRGLNAQLDASRDRSVVARAELLRLAVMMRLFDQDPADAADVEVLLTELGSLADTGGDPRMLGEVASLRAYRTITFGRTDNALPDAATALAVLAEITGPAEGEDPAEWSRLVARALNGLMLVLVKLGSHELADDVSQRAVAIADAGGIAMERLVHQLNRVRLLLSWALRLERGGRQAAAATRFLGAAQTAHDAALLWGPAFGRNFDLRGAAVAECAVIGSAYALARPGPAHLPVLESLHPMAHFTEDRILLAIATARCLMADGRRAEAARALDPLRAELADDHSENVLAIALHREFALVHEVSRGVGRPSDALTRYAAALEGELWDLREARIAALRSHFEHHRLALEHGAVAAQALSDPLTGLPNRRALDLRLAEIGAEPGGRPYALALIDLDGFKVVNDARSHAVGDAVLRAVASCIRSALRAQDLVARYGGDEFVVVLPDAPLAVAQAALGRATEAVAALPNDVGAGVTISVGVADVGSAPEVALADADAAMYRAKRAGGNRVAGPEPIPGPRHRGRGPRLRSVPLPVPAPSDEADDPAMTRLPPALVE